MDHLFCAVCLHLSISLLLILSVGSSSVVLIHITFNIIYCCVFSFVLFVVHLLWCLICTIEFVTAIYREKENSMILVECGAIHSFRCFLKVLESMIVDKTRGDNCCLNATPVTTGC